MTVVSIGQPSYMPWLGAFDRIARSDIFVALDHVPCSGGENRNIIRTSQGTQLLTVPLKKHTNIAIADVEIADDPHWRHKHWRAIQQNYSRADFFHRHEDFFEELYSKEWYSLCGLNLAIMDDIMYQWEIKTPVIRSTEMKARGTKSQLNLNICLEVGATVYLSGPYGREYLDIKSFNDHGIEVIFHDYKDIHPEWRQCWGEGDFVPCLSALDALFNLENMPS